MELPINLIKYLNENEWNLEYKSEKQQYEGGLMSYYHYTKNVKRYDNIFHLFIEEYDNGNVEVQLGEDGNEQDSEFFKLRNLVSVLKKRGL